MLHKAEVKAKQTMGKKMHSLWRLSKLADRELFMQLLM